MNAIVRPLRLTAEEFEQMSETDGYELIDGIPREKNMGADSSRVNLRVGRLIGAFVDDNRLGHAFDSECTYQCFPLSPRTVRKPDVSFIRFGRLPGEVVPPGHNRVPPDFVVEVISPRDTWYEVEGKLNDYLSVNVPLIWVVNPNARTLHVYKPDGSVTRHPEADAVTADPVLPGFRVRVADLLPPPQPAPDTDTPPSDDGE
jgi:Uma2 family endonuclease